MKRTSEINRDGAVQLSAVRNVIQKTVRLSNYSLIQAKLTDHLTCFLQKSKSKSVQCSFEK